MLTEIRHNILNWYDLNKRSLPWRGSKDPYTVWLSEIILQQTRIDQGTSYFLTFKQHYPTILDFAHAAEDEILKHWQGLGYYSRARNMHHTARKITEEHNGIFPGDYKQLLALKGIGEYTAAMILSVCFDQPYAVVDGNVFRVLARLFEIHEPINTPAGKKRFWEVADKLLARQRAGDFNQALMDFGSMICTPQKPGCTACPLNHCCMAAKKGVQLTLPKKTDKKPLRNRFFHYLIVTHDDHVLVQQRKAKDIWKNLFEFPMIETVGRVTLNAARVKEELQLEVDQLKQVYATRHILTHQELHIRFYVTGLRSLPKPLPSHFQVVLKNKLDSYAVPRPIEFVITHVAF